MRVFSITYGNVEAIVCGYETRDAAVSAAFPPIWTAGLEDELEVKEILGPTIVLREATQAAGAA